MIWKILTVLVKLYEISFLLYTNLTGILFMLTSSQIYLGGKLWPNSLLELFHPLSKIIRKPISMFWWTLIEFLCPFQLNPRNKLMLFRNTSRVTNQPPIPRSLPCYMPKPLNVMRYLNINNFYFYFSLFSDFILIFFFFFFILYDEEACDIIVTWHVTWCDIIGLEHGGRVWKITLGHIYITWGSLVRSEANMRIKHRHEGRVNY